MASSLLSAQY
ncbi:hypothetical protein YPPY01_1346, partial [Yersinia pestis PY-01]